MSLSFGHLLLILAWASVMLAQAPRPGDSLLELDRVAVEQIDKNYLYAPNGPWQKARADILGTNAADKEARLEIIRTRLAQLGDSELHLVTPSELAAIQRESDGETIGTGLMEFSIDVVPETVAARVVTPLIGSPAAIAGLRPRDVIAEVNRRPTRDLDHEQVLDYLRSPKGADLLIRRGKRRLSVHLVPSDAPLHSVVNRMLTNDGGGPVAYLRIVQFTRTVPDNMRSAIALFEPEHPRGYVLDLRNNPGGFLDAASHVCGLFITGDLGDKVRRTGMAEPITIQDTPVTDAPLVVLVNEGTASAAEFVAAALQARHRAIIVGTRTYGRGQAQVYEPLPEGYGLIIPSALIRAPDGRLFKGTGLMPDIQVASGPLVKAEIDPNGDAQLRRALVLLLRGKG